MTFFSKKNLYFEAPSLKVQGRKNTVWEVWRKAKVGPNGGRLCAKCKKEVFVRPFSGIKRDWHIDHILPWSKRGMPLGTPRKHYIDDYQKGVQLLCPHCNMSKGNRSN